MIYLYTDGSCMKRYGGWAFCVIIDGECKLSYSGAAIDTTNQRMELVPIYKGLQLLNRIKPKEHITIVSDSSYSLNTFGKWMYSWEVKGWRRNKKAIPLNLDIIQSGYRLIKPMRDRLTWEWVKGHSGNKYNELCDKMAKEKAQEIRKLHENC